MSFGENFKTMRKIVLTYGLIGGLIVGSMFFVTIPFWESGAINFDNGEIVGYTSMVIALSVIFFAIKSYRDKYLNGSISFWQGVKVGLLVTLVAGLIYAAAWEVSYRTTNRDFAKNYTEYQVARMQEAGKSEAEIEARRQQMAEFTEWYGVFIIRFSFSIVEILPVGIALPWE